MIWKPAYQFRRVHARRGAALIELAIVMPVLLMVVFGIIEFGQMTYVRQTLISAANVGARRAILPGATEAIVKDATELALVDGGLDASDVNIVYTSGVGPDDLRETVTVSVAYGDISLLGGIYGEFTLTSACTMLRGPFD